MKWVGRILYIIVIMFIGFIVVQQSDNNKRRDYYFDKVEELEEKGFNNEEFMEIVMTSRLLESYLKDPIYVVNADDATFTLSLYHAKINVGKDSEKSFIFFHFENKGIDFSNRLNKYQEEDFEKELVNAIIELNVKLEIEDKKEDQIDTTIGFYSVYQETQQPLLTLEVTKDGFTGVHGREEINGSGILEISLSIVDGTHFESGKQYDEEDLIRTTLINVEVDNSFNGDTTTATKTTVDGVELYYSNDLNGTKEFYNRDSLYEDESNLGEIKKEDLAKYNHIYVKGIAKYAVAIFFLTYLIFFLRPTINLIKSKRQKPALESPEEKVEVEQIFKDPVETEDKQ